MSISTCKEIIIDSLQETGKAVVLIGQFEEDAHKLTHMLCSPKRYGPIVHMACSKLSYNDIECT